MRKAHYLKPNAKHEFPSHCVYVDTETTPTQLPGNVTENKLAFGWACYSHRQRGKWSDGEWVRFTTPRGFFIWLEKHAISKRKLYVYCHNYSFDALVIHLFSEMAELGYELKRAILEEPPNYFEYVTWKDPINKKGVERSINFVDTLNYFRMSLKKLGIAINRSKMELPSYGDNQEKWDAYCKNDVLVLKAAIELWFDFLREHDLGNVQITVASQAFSAYRHRFMKIPIFIDDCRASLTLARQSYYGGRCEAWFLGHETGDFYQVDINSMYPFIMRERSYPTKLVGYTGIMDLESFNSRVKSQKYIYIADVVVESTKPIFPMRFMKKLIFPTGKFRTVLSGDELQYAVEHDLVRGVFGLSAYEQGRIFSDYVDYFYPLRKKLETEGNYPFAFLTKIMLNSLSGKFGQTGRVYEKIGTCDDVNKMERRSVINADTGEVFSERTFAGIVQKISREAESRDSHPAIAACVTANARMYLWSLIELAGAENIYYMDTDCLVINKSGYENMTILLDDSKLGFFKLERNFDKLDIRGLKDYQFGKSRKIKGIRASAKKESENLYTQELWRGIRGAIRDKDGERQIITTITKNLSRKYTKGIIQGNGNVTPLIFGYDDTYGNILSVSAIPAYQRKNFSEKYEQKIVFTWRKQDYDEQAKYVKQEYAKSGGFNESQAHHAARLRELGL